MKKIFLLSAFLSIFMAPGAFSQTGNADLFNEPHRPQYHFSPVSNWMNDPNGLVYHEGEYHLFYQYNPYGNTWGHMSWGHAVSRDLVHWQHLPVALKEENGIMIFSGSAVVDRNNSTGFGSPDNPPLVAIYTGHRENKKEIRQDQRIAYSLDNGRTWTKYQGNPVIDEEMADFRDPKVIWHEETGKWVMVVALSKEQKVRFYSSSNLKEWELMSEFGPAGASENLLWECPELFELEVEGDPGKSRWVLQVDVNPGSVAGGSGGQYFIGEFDGTRFVQEAGSQNETNWVDYGRDFYAVQSFSNISESDGRRIWLAWMNNWDYAQKIPTYPWRSAMTIPREVSLKKLDGEYRLIQEPVRELKKIRGEHIHLQDMTIDSGSTRPLPDLAGKVYELKVEFETRKADRFGINLHSGTGEQTVIGYDVNTARLFVDRRISGQVVFDSSFASMEHAPVRLSDGKLALHIFVDRSSVEIFAGEGSSVITDRIFPGSDSNRLEVFSEGGPVTITRLDHWDLKSIWKHSHK